MGNVCAEERDHHGSWKLPDRPAPILCKVLRACSIDNEFSTWVHWLPQMTMTAAIPEPPQVIDREIISLPVPQGGRVAVDWVGGLRHGDGKPSMIVFGMPGIGASATKGFMGAAAHYLAAKVPDARVAVMVGQGMDGVPLESPAVTSTCYLSTNDPGFLLDHIAAKCPNVPIVVLANSIGAGHWVRFAGSNPAWCKRVGVVGCIGMCFGYSVAVTSAAGDATPGITSFALSNWQASVSANEAYLRGLERSREGFKYDALMQARTIREFEDATCALYGWSCQEDLLRAVETNEVVFHLAVPTVFIGSDDDPLTPATRLLDHHVDKIPVCAVLCTNGGGHMSWWSGPPWDLRQEWIFETVQNLCTAFAVHGDSRTS